MDPFVNDLQDHMNLERNTAVNLIKRIDSAVRTQYILINKKFFRPVRRKAGNI
jgi:hypothetical protein